MRDRRGGGRSQGAGPQPCSGLWGAASRRIRSSGERGAAAGSGAGAGACPSGGSLRVAPWEVDGRAERGWQRWG